MDSKENDQVSNRRPLKVRDMNLMHRISVWLCQKKITPNQISVTSVGFAVLAAICFLALPWSQGWWSMQLPVLAAVFIQCRLLCNLFDGMVAVEGGQSTASGELFNDIPDRIADPLILVACGYAITVVGWADIIGWCAALFAVLTAYVRTLSASIGAPVDFKGPMAKQHRMAIITIAALLTAFEGSLWQQGYFLLAALLVVAVGSAITAGRRAYTAYRYLEDRAQGNNNV